jgi:hypothetical protein
MQQLQQAHPQQAERKAAHGPVVRKVNKNKKELLSIVRARIRECQAAEGESEAKTLVNQIAWTGSTAQLTSDLMERFKRSVCSQATIGVLTQILKTNKNRVSQATLEHKEKTTLKRRLTSRRIDYLKHLQSGLQSIPNDANVLQMQDLLTHSRLFPLLFDHLDTAAFSAGGIQGYDCVRGQPLPAPGVFIRCFPSNLSPTARDYFRALETAYLALRHDNQPHRFEDGAQDAPAIDTRNLPAHFVRAAANLLCFL